jgi:hypothetical protein
MTVEIPGWWCLTWLLLPVIGVAIIELSQWNR